MSAPRLVFAGTRGVLSRRIQDDLRSNTETPRRITCVKQVGEEHIEVAKARLGRIDSRWRTIERQRRPHQPFPKRFCVAKYETVRRFINRPG